MSQAAPDPTPTQIVLQTAALARLDLQADEARELGTQFARILEAFRRISEVDVEGVAPMTGPSGQTDVVREDRPRTGLEREEVLSRAPEREGDFFRVPRTVGGGGEESEG